MSTTTPSALVANTLRALRRLSPHNPTPQAARAVAAQLWHHVSAGSLDAIIAACDRDVTLATALLGLSAASVSHEFDDASEDPLANLSTALADFAEHLTTEDAATRITESAEALDAFRSTLPGSNAHRTAACVSSMPDGAVEVALVDVGPAARRMRIWERQLFHGNSSTAIALWIAENIAPVVLTSSATRSWVPSPMHRYHPERFRASRRYAKLARDAIASTSASARVLSEAELQFRGDLIVSEINARLNQVDRREQLRREVHPTVVIETEERLLTAWLSYGIAGRQIFEIPAPLVAMLRHTDADDIPVSLLRVPYAALYLQFGPQPDLELEPGWPIDGAYIDHLPDQSAYTFTFTAAPTNPTDIHLWPAFGEPHAVIQFTAEHAGMDLGTAVDHVLSDLLHQLGTEQAAGDRDGTADMHLAAISQGLAISPTSTLTITSGSRATQQIATARKRYPAMRGALQLAVNALCYLTAYPDDITEAWPAGTPRALIAQTTHGTPKARPKAVTQLEAMGYTKVRLCGTRLTSPTPIPLPCTAAHSSVRPHWRRGHWRRQPHGEGRASRKLIWLMPTLVHRDNLHRTDAAPGHLYLASN